MKFIVKTSLCMPLLHGMLFTAAATFCGTEATLMELQEKLAVCNKRKELFLQERDHFNCLPRIDLLQTRLNELEQQAAITPLKKQMELALHQTANTPNLQVKNKLQTLDEHMVKFKKEHHQQISSIEREIAKLAQKMLQNLSAQEKYELRQLLKERELLKTDINKLDFSSPAGQATIFELLFI